MFSVMVSRIRPMLPATCATSDGALKWLSLVQSSPPTRLQSVL